MREAPNTGGVTILKAVAAVALWKTARFDTLEIAHCLDMTEADVVAAIHVARQAAKERAAVLT